MSVDFTQKLFKKSDFANCQKVIAAVSGGSDSLALLFLLKHYLSTLEDAPKFLAVTVDHRLRAESAAEAEKVAAICHQNNIEHKTVCWADGKAQTALSHKARIARYGLLFSQAEACGANVIMTGHTMNDQAETYRMRLSRGSRRGLACMPRQSLLMRKVKLLRPLLCTKRETLRQYLRSLEQSWIDDPSNQCDDYERVQIRKSLDDKDIEIYAKAAEEAAIVRKKQSQSAAKLFQVLNVNWLQGYVAFAHPDEKIISHNDYSFVVGVMAAIMGGASYLPTDTQTAFLDEQLKKQHNNLYRFTLLGAVIEKTQKHIRIWRESRNQFCSMIGPGQSAIWDGRYRIDNLGAKPIKVGVPSLCDIKALLRTSRLPSREFHFPSLQTSLAIFSRGGVDIPAINGKIEYAGPVHCERFMRPFGWLVSSDDYSLFDVLKPVFEAELVAKTKNMNESS